MAQSLRSQSSRARYGWDILNAADDFYRYQAFPLVLRDVFKYIFSSTSLTSLLRNRYYHVEVECVALTQDKLNLLWCRDVFIHANKQVQWVARTEIPETTHQFMQHFFNLSVHQPIGDFLFSSQAVKRMDLEFSIVKEHPLPWQNKRAWYWMRKSIWEIADTHPMVVIEYF